MITMERRRVVRRSFSYYMRVMEESTGNLIGHFSDISTSGFKVDSNKPVSVNANYRLRIEQMGGISNKSFITFTARAKWCKTDPFDPNMYNIGFQITEMTPSDYDIFMKMFSTYSYTR